MIETRYTLPALIAASAHIALFLAFPKAQPPAIADPAETITRVVTRVFPLEPVTVQHEETEKTTQSRQSGNPGVPELPDIRVIKDIADFTVPHQPVSVSTNERLTVSPIGPFSTGTDKDGTPGIEATLYSVDNLDQPPRAKLQNSPVYPVNLRQSGIEGQATVRFTVDQRGNVIAAEVLQDSHPGFGDAAVRAILKWRFEPGRVHGHAVPFRMSIPVQFNLQPD